MTIELSNETRQMVVASIQRYFQENMDDPIGNITAGALLSFFLEEIGPVVYNKAVSDAQQQLQSRVKELDLEVYEDEIQYWSKAERKRKAK